MLKFVIAVCCMLNSAVLLKSEPRIVGGTPAVDGQFPYQVSIQLKSSNFHFCGGSLIDLRHVLTAGHCIRDLKTGVDKKPSELVVWAGGIDHKSNDGQTQHVKKITVHPNFDKNKDLDSDAAILELAHAFQRTKYLDTISLTNSTTPDNAACVVSGWGTTRYEGPTPKKLLYANVTLLNHDSCSKKYHGTGVIMTQNMICAAGALKDACQGDSGGPLAYNNKLIGIVSFGIGCADPRYPGIYTNVLKFVKWIEQNSLASLNSVQTIQIVAMLISSTLFSLFYR